MAFLGGFLGLGWVWGLFFLDFLDLGLVFFRFFGFGFG